MANGVVRSILATVVGVASVAAVSLLPQAPIGFLLIPIIAVAYRGKLAMGFLATAIISLLSWLWLVPEDPVRALTVAVDGVFITVVIEALHRSRARERVARLREQTSQRRFEQLFHASPVAMSLSSVGANEVVEANEAYLRAFGLRRDELLQHPLQRTELARDACELEIQGPEGPRWVMQWSREIDLEGTPFALSTFVDITEHKRAREAAHASDERVRELAENLHEVFWLTDPRTYDMLYVSPAYEKIFGRSCADLYANPREWLDAIHPDDRERLRQKAVSANGQPWEEQYRILRPDGVERTLHVSVTPVRDAAGNVVRLAGVGEDVTDKLALESQVRETQKLESLGLLAGGVAHDFNNILAVIAANASLLAETTRSGDESELVQEIESAVSRATSLTRQLLAFSRKQVIEPVVLDLNHAVVDVRKMLRRMVGEDISIMTSLEPDLGHVQIDPGYLVQVIMNLAVNARDAMPRGGTLNITTRTAIPGREISLAISDTGCGMPADVKHRIFEPFFTTKDVGRGTGLGLSVVHGIVQQAGGRIEVESEVGIGTTFKIYLPLVDAPAERIADVAVVGAAGTEQIVVVDDDMFVRAATSRALRARGYQVFEASDGHAALRLLHDHHEVKLLVTDVVMPGLDGRELVEVARQRRPSLKVLYVSGYTDDTVLRHGIQRADVALLEKPFRGHALVGKVRQILDAT